MCFVPLGVIIGEPSYIEIKNSYKHKGLAKFELISTKLSTNNYVDLELA